MEPPLLSHLVKPLLQHARCKLRPFSVPVAGLGPWHPRHRHVPHLAHLTQPAQRRFKTDWSNWTPWGPTEGNDSEWQQRTLFLPTDREAEFIKCPIVTAQQLRKRRDRPRKVRMLMRDFIEDSLYNPSYGYFSKQATIFTPGEPFDLISMKDQDEFDRALGDRYTIFEDALDAENYDATRQLWHTPTELFSPHYGEAIGRYVLSNYIASMFPYNDLIIYEMGAGRGTMMLNILDYLREVEPVIYSRTRYRIIEISESLASIQQAQVAASRGHGERVEIIHKSIFDWDQPVVEPCFFLAMEVMDNFAHDCIRYNLTTEEPMQAWVLIDGKGDFYEFYQHELDPLTARFFRVRHAATGGIYPVPYPRAEWMRSMVAKTPAGTNLSAPEYLPTRLMQFFDVLDKYFPAHRLLTSDFNKLPSACEGLNAPVVQTRYERVTVPVRTPLVHQGYFDILFPSDFRTTEALYQAITGKLTKITSQQDFLNHWAYIEDTQTESGESPLLTYYENASVMMTVS